VELSIQYCKTNDGVSIAYATAGEGRPVVLVPSVPLSHVQRQGGTGRRLAERFYSVWYDSRGSGLSDREQTDFSMAAMQRDLEAVIAASSAAPGVLVGLQDGAPIAIGYAAAHADLVTHMVIVDGWSHRSSYKMTTTIDAEQALRRGDWDLYTETFGRVLAGYHDTVQAATVGETIRASVEQEALRAVYAATNTATGT
jgi:pimeloyl-ACP methyl ester carboxylesterase